MLNRRTKAGPFSSMMVSLAVAFNMLVMPSTSSLALATTPELATNAMMASALARSPYQSKARSKKWVVVLDGNGGKASDGMTTKRISSDDDGRMALPDTPYARKGHAFVGWSELPDGAGGLLASGQEVSSLAEPGDTTTLYAVWEKLPATKKAGKEVKSDDAGIKHSSQKTSNRSNQPVSTDNDAVADIPSDNDPSESEDDGQGANPTNAPPSVATVRAEPSANTLSKGMMQAEGMESAGNKKANQGRRIPTTGESGFHIAAAVVSRTLDGTAPWDADDASGNDSSDSNGVVRSFDSIAYTLGYTTALDDPTVPVSEGSVLAHLSLPLSPKAAKFDVDSLSWMLDKVITYTYADGHTETFCDTDTGGTDYMGTLEEVDWHYDGESEEWEHGDVVLQEISGRRYLSSLSNAIPGAGTLSLSILTKAAMDGQQILPSMELSSAGSTPVTVSGFQPITASAAPLYDLYLRYESDTTGRSWMYIDPVTGLTYPTAGEGRMRARLYGYGVVFALRNENTTKGFKGVALPTGQVQFDVRLDSSFLSFSAVEGTAPTVTTFTEGFAPFLWDVHESGRPYASATTPYGNGIWDFSGGEPTMTSQRQMRDFSSTSSSQPRYVPYNEHTDDPGTETKKRYEASCYDGGNAFATTTDEPNVWRIILDNFHIDYKDYEFPSRNINGSVTTYLQSAGTVASTYFMVALPLTDDTHHGNAYLNVNIENMACMAEGEEWLTYRNETITTNNLSGHNAVTYGPGTYSHHVYYADNDTWDSGDYQTYESQKNKITVYNSTTAETSFKGVNLLLKFDDEFGEIAEGTTDAYSASVGVVSSEIPPATYTTLFAAKPDGTGWVDDAELQNATEESLIFFDSIDDLNASGMTCVGVLLEARGEIWKSPAGTLCTMTNYVKTKHGVENGAVYEIMAGTRAWADTSDDPISWTDEPYRHVNAQGITYYGLGDSSWTVDRFSTVVDGSYVTSYQYKPGYPVPRYAQFGRYTKTQYANGEVVGGHIGGVLNGDSALIIGDLASIHVMSVLVDGSEKTFYDLDNGERTAMFKIVTTTDYVSANQALSSDGLRDNLTITVTLPASLHYKDGSASVEPLSVTHNPDGTTTLVFYVEDVEVGGEATEITILGTIGDVGQPDDVENNDSIMVEATVVPDNNPSAPSSDDGTLSDATIRVIKLAASAVAKEVGIDVSELGGDNWWTLHVGNASEIDILNASVLDILPYVGDERGTDFHGGYRVTGISIDLSDAEGALPSSMYAYVTTSTDVRGKDASDVLSLGAGIWAGCPRSIDGDTVSFSMPSGVDASKITAVRLLYGNMAMKEYLHTRIDWSPKDASDQMITGTGGSVQQGMDTYSNTFSQWSDNQASVVSSNLVTERVVQREVHGVAWLDADHDGLRQEGETLLADIPVMLVDANGDPFVSLTTGQPLTTVTAADGSYEFLNVPAGTAYVKFLNQDGHCDLDPYAATIRKAKANGESQPEIDSDVTGTNKANGKLDYMLSDGIHLPTARQLPSPMFSVHNIDAGVTPKSATWVPAINKRLLGHTLMHPFQYDILDEGSNIVSTGQSNTSDGWVTFSPVHYTSADAGQHTYRIRERNDHQPGVAYDLADRTVTVTVEDLGEASMGIKETVSGSTHAVSDDDMSAYGEETELSHSAGGHHRLGIYTPSSEALALSDGMFEAGKAYTVSFKMRKLGGTLSSIGGAVTGIADATVMVDGRESSVPLSSGASLPNDREVHVVSVSFLYTSTLDDPVMIKPNIGTTDAVAVDIWDMEVTEDPEVDNEYHTTGDWLPSVRKAMTGKPLLAGQFTFELLDEDEHVIDTATNDENGNVTFNRIQYGNDDRDRVKTYYVREVNAGQAGYTYEQNTRTIRVSVTDNNDGTLKVAVTGMPNILDGYQFAGSVATVASDQTGHLRSTATGVASQRPVVRIGGDQLEAGKTYRLQWKSKKGEGLVTPSTVMADMGGCEVVSMTVDGVTKDGTALASGIAISQTGAHHVIEAVISCPDGWDATNHIDIMPAGDGTTAGTYETYDFRLDEIAKLPLFTNAYKATGSWTPIATKTLTGREIESNRFSFEVALQGDDVTSEVSATGATYDAMTGVMTIPSSGNTTITLPSPSSTVMYGGSGTWELEMSVDSSSVTATLDENNNLTSGGTAGDNDLSGDASTYARQRIGHVDGIECDRDGTSPALMTFAIPSGSWHAIDQTYTNDATSNTRQLPLVEAGTTLTVRGATAIRLRNVRLSVTQSVAMNMNGTVTFPIVSYDESDIGKTYTYLIREQDLREKGYEYDHHIETVTVTVTDNGNGTLGVASDADSDGTTGTAFANAYAATGDVTLIAWKILQGRELTDGEFTFEAYDEDNHKVAEGTNDADGIVELSAIHFDQTAVGHTYAYEVREKAGTDTTVTYSDQVFRYQVTVSDDGNGSLSFETKNVDATGAEVTTLPIFTNGLADGSVAIEKRAEGGVGNETFEYLLRLRKEDGTPLTIDDMDEHIIVVPLDGGTAGGESVGSSPSDGGMAGTESVSDSQGDEEGEGNDKADATAPMPNAVLIAVSEAVAPVIVAGSMLKSAWDGLVGLLLGTESTQDGNFTIDQVMSGIDYGYTGGVQKFVAPYTGQYKLEVWGASGGAGNGNSLKTQSSHGGWGGESSGFVTLQQGDTLYVIVGGAGSYGAGTSSFGGSLGGYNGGGNAGNSSSGSGGGMTHISTTSNPIDRDAAWDPTGTIIVAGGGGGADNASGEGVPTGTGHDDGSGGDGGGEIGGAGFVDGIEQDKPRVPAGGVANGDGCGMGGSTTDAEGFARGQGESVTVATDTGGAGGGWYGGYVSNHNNGGAGGGSGYVNPSYVSGGTMQNGTNYGNGRARITCMLVVDPNGGVWDDGDSASEDVRCYSQTSGTRSINDPTRDGYRFVGWAEVGTGQLVSSTSGDGAFSSGTNGMTPYNTVGNGSVTIARATGATPYGDDTVTITHQPIKESKPQLGGFSLMEPTSGTGRYLVMFSAKIPEDYYVQSSANGQTVTWLTDRRGTGDWRTYAYIVEAGSNDSAIPLVLPDDFSDLTSSNWTHQLPATTPTTYDATTGMSHIQYGTIGGWETLISNPIAVTPGQKYRLEFDYQTLTPLLVYDGYGGWFGLGIHDYANPVPRSGSYTSGTTVGQNTFSYDVTTGTVHEVIEFTAPASGQVYMQIQGGFLHDNRSYELEIGNFGPTTSVYLTRDPMGTYEEQADEASSEAMSWQVAYADVTDITNGCSYDFASGPTRLTAQWEPISYKVTYHYQNDDEYLAGQGDTLGMTVDWTKEQILTGRFETDAASDSVNLMTTGTGTQSLTVGATAGQVNLTHNSASDTMPETVDTTTGQPFGFVWTPASKSAYAYISPTDPDMGVQSYLPALTGSSEGEATIGAPASTGRAGVHASDYAWRIPYDKGETVTMPHPTRIGYRFLGWDTEPDGTGTRYAANQQLTDIVAEGETHLYAQWEIRTYQVLFNANTGTGNMPSQTFTWNQTQSLSANTFQKFNYRFTGWNTKADGSGTAYSDGQAVRNILEGDVSSGDYQITLYAQWERVPNSSQVDEGTWQISVPANGKVLIQGLPASVSYEVTELPKADWVLYQQENVSGTVVPLQTQTAKFWNRYSPNSTSLVLAVSKLLDDAAPQGNGQFEFVLSRGGTEIDRKTNSGGGVTFDPLLFDATDLNQTYTYDIAEVQGSDSAISYDTRHKSVTVTVTQGATGLEASAQYATLVPGTGGSATPSETDATTFRNESIPGSLAISKVVANATASASGRQFAMDVSLMDASGTPLAGTYQASNGESIVNGVGVIHVSGGQTVTIPNLPARTRYVVSERPADAFQQTAATGTTGTITANETASAAFTNSYSATGSATVQATKQLVGRALQGGEFTFMMSDRNGNHVGSAVCLADGSIMFPAMEYDESAVGQTYLYRISEVIDADRIEDIVYDETVEWVSVTVTDPNGNGTLSTQVTYDVTPPAGTTGLGLGAGRMSVVPHGTFSASDLDADSDGIQGVTVGNKANDSDNSDGDATDSPASPADGNLADGKGGNPSVAGDADSTDGNGNEDADSADSDDDREDANTVRPSATIPPATAESLLTGVPTLGGILAGDGDSRTSDGDDADDEPSGTKAPSSDGGMMLAEAAGGEDEGAVFTNYVTVTMPVSGQRGLGLVVATAISVMTAGTCLVALEWLQRRRQGRRS